MAFDSDLMRATAETIILRLLNERRMYGYEIIKIVNERTDGAFQWKEGTLYPCLHRLEGAGLIASEWQDGDAGKAASIVCPSVKSDRPEPGSSIRDVAELMMKATLTI